MASTNNYSLDDGERRSRCENEALRVRRSRRHQVSGSRFKLIASKAIIKHRSILPFLYQLVPMINDSYKWAEDQHSAALLSSEHYNRFQAQVDICLHGKWREIWQTGAMLSFQTLGETHLIFGVYKRTNAHRNCQLFLWERVQKYRTPGVIYILEVRAMVLIVCLTLNMSVTVPDSDLWLCLCFCWQILAK